MLAERRRGAGIRQVDLAAALGLPQPFISMLERDLVQLHPQFIDEYLDALSEFVGDQVGSEDGT